ncbi:MAG: hypothetical protein J6S49_08455 [Erysipelotrichaceae bacterium]|nr:hypothetical protein [Erysipelotrichaceae bacterium]
MNIVMEFPDTVDEFMEQYKMTDTECVYSNGVEYVPIFRMEQWFKHLEAKPKTNADRIRAMSDEELASVITDDWCEIVCNGTYLCNDGTCEQHVLKWLKEEVKE